jgi:hypothetical protein
MMEASASTELSDMIRKSQAKKISERRRSNMVGFQRNGALLKEREYIVKIQLKACCSVQTQIL